MLRTSHQSSGRRSSSSGMRDDASEPSSSATGAAGSHGCPSPTMSSKPQDLACGSSIRPGAVLVTAQRVAPASSRGAAYVSRGSKGADKQGDSGRLLARIQYLESKLRHQEVEHKAALARADLLSEQRGRLQQQVTQLSDNMQGMVRSNERLSSENSRLHSLLHHAHMACSSSASSSAASRQAAGLGPHPGLSPFAHPPPHHSNMHCPGGGLDQGVELTGQPSHLGRSHSDGLLALRQQMAGAAVAAAAAAEVGAEGRPGAAAAGTGCGWVAEGGCIAPADRWLLPPTPLAPAPPAAAAGSSGGAYMPGPPALPFGNDLRSSLAAAPPGSNTPGGCHRLRFDQRAWSSPAMPCHMTGPPQLHPPGRLPLLPRPPMEHLLPAGAGGQCLPGAWHNSTPPHFPVPSLRSPPPATAAAAAAAADARAPAGVGMCVGPAPTRGSARAAASGGGVLRAPPAATTTSSRKRGHDNLSSPEVAPPPPAAGRVAAAGSGGAGGQVPGACSSSRGKVAPPAFARIITTTAPARSLDAAAAAGAPAAVVAVKQEALPRGRTGHMAAAAAAGGAAAKRLKQAASGDIPAAPAAAATAGGVVPQSSTLDQDSCLLLMPGGLGACSSPCQRVGSPAVTNSGGSGATAAYQYIAGGCASPSTEQAAVVVAGGCGAEASNQLLSLPGYFQGSGVAAAEGAGGDGLLLGLGGLPAILMGGGPEGEGEELLTGAGWDWLTDMAL